MKGRSAVTWDKIIDRAFEVDKELPHFSEVDELREDLKYERKNDLTQARDLGSSTSGNYGHAGRPGEVGGSAPSDSSASDSDSSSDNTEGDVPTVSFGTETDIPLIKQSLEKTPVPVTGAETIGGEHTFPVYDVTTSDGIHYVFKPDKDFDNGHDVREWQIDPDANATLGEREVIAATIAKQLGMEDLVPDAHMAEIAEPEPIVATIPTPEPLVFPSGPISYDDIRPVPDEIRLAPPESRTPPSEHSGVIATTIGGLNASQKLDAWGRPVWVGRFAPENIVGKEGPSTPKTPTPSAPTSGGRDDDDDDDDESKFITGRVGALIRFVEDGSPGDDHYNDGSNEDRARLATFDTVIGNLDRHGQNYMMVGDKIKSIDHGLAFPDVHYVEEKVSSHRFPPKQTAGALYGGRVRSFFLSDKESIPQPSIEWQKDMAKRLSAIDWDTQLKATRLTSGERLGVVNRAAVLIKAFQEGKGFNPVVQKITYWD